MSDDPTISDRLRDLVDAYLDGTIDTADLAELESLLRADGAARAYFVRYAHTHTDLALEVAARAATERALARLPEPSAERAAPRSAGRARSARSVRWLVAASLLLGMSVGGGVVGLFAAPAQPRPRSEPAPRALALDFRGARPGTLADAAGAGTGFTHRLPGTGAALPAGDPNLRLRPGAGGLELTATGSDLNTRFRLD